MRGRSILLVLFATLMSYSLSAQKMTSGYLFPAGGQVGTTVEIEAGGLNINKAVKVLFNHPGISGELAPYVEPAAATKRRKRLNDQSSPQLADKVKIKITIADNVPCGLYELRLQGPQGVSNMLPFEVASYPDVVESGKSTLRKPNVVPSLPAVLCGQVTPGGIDYFKFSGCEGDRIVATVKARQLVPYIADAVPGWFQPVIKIVDARGREVAYSDDYLYNVDPVIITTLPKDGDYTLMIHDAIYRGRADFNYRIQIGQIPFVTGRYPAYGVVGKKTKQRLVGENLGAEQAIVKVKKEGYNSLTFTNGTGTSNAVSFYALPKRVKLLQSPKEGTTLTVSTAIADSLTANSKIKRYKVNVEARQPLFVELIGRRNGSSIDAVMRLRDVYGRVVAEVDDTEDPIQGLMTFHADPVLKYTPKQSGVLLLEVEDLHRGYGEQYHYLLRRYNQMPSFNAFVSPANITIPSGGTASFRVDISGKIKRPANLIIEGLPKGFTTSSLEFRGSKRWDFSITAPKGAAVERLPIELKMEYSVGDALEQTEVLPVDNMMQAFYYTHHIPAAELSLDVVAPSPYRMSLSFDVEQDVNFSVQDDVVPIKVIIDKDPGFNEPIELLLGRKNGNYTLDPVTVLPEEREKIVYLKLNKESLAKHLNKKNLPKWQTYIVGTVKGEIVKQGRRTFQNAKYREMTPIFVLQMQR